VPIFTGLSPSLTAIPYALKVGHYLLPLLDINTITPEGCDPTAIKALTERLFNVHEATSGDLNDRVSFMVTHMSPPAIFSGQCDLFWDLCLGYAMEGLGLSSPDELLCRNNGGSSSGGVEASLRDWIPTRNRINQVNHLCQLDPDQKVFPPFFLGEHAFGSGSVAAQEVRSNSKSSGLLFLFLCLPAVVSHVEVSSWDDRQV